MVVIESTGRKLKDAIDNGLKQLNKTLMDVDVEVLDNGGLFRKAKVRISVKGDADFPAEPVAVPKNEPKKEPLIKEAAPQKKEDLPKKEVREQKREPKEPKRELRDDQPKPKKEVKKEQPAAKPAAKPAVKKEQPVKEETKELRRNVPVTPEVANTAEQLARNIVTKMGIDCTVTSSIVAGGVVVDLAAQTSELIGYHGEVLDAIEYIISCAINRDDDKYYRVVVDCDNYRAKRKESLVALANKMAAKCLKIRHKVVLEPMNSNERRIIHATLANNDKLITRSEGHEPNRRVVIFCKRR